MGNDITAGYTYADTEVGREVTVSNLNQLITEATLKDTAISARTNKSTPLLSDKFLLSDGALKYATLQNIKDILLAAGFLTADATGRALMADGFITGAKMYAGAVLQTRSTTYTTNAALSISIPVDDSIPQNTEGTQILSDSITPASTLNKILVKFNAFGGRASELVTIVAAIFRNSTADAIAVTAQSNQNASGQLTGLSLQYLDSPASISAQTYSIRVGSSSSDIALNGRTNSLARVFGGQAAATMILQEIKG